MTAPRILGFGGTTRTGSSSELLLRRALALSAAKGAQTQLFDGPFLAGLPHYAPENPARSAAQRDFVQAVRDCDGLLIATPAYHAGVSGLVKNAMDLLEDLRADSRVYFDGLPVGLIVSAAGWQGTGVTLSALRDIVQAMRGWPTPISVTVNTLAGPIFTADGGLCDARLQASLDAQAEQILKFAEGTKIPKERHLPATEEAS